MLTIQPFVFSLRFKAPSLQLRRQTLPMPCLQGQSVEELLAMQDAWHDWVFEVGPRYFTEASAELRHHLGTLRILRF